MEAFQVLFVQDLLRMKGIDTCVVGDMCADYYNYPRCVFEIELCVQEARMQLAESILTMEETGFTRSQTEDVNVFNEYKAHFPLFKCTRPCRMFLRLIPHSFFHVDIMQANTVTPAFIDSAEISHELFDMSPDDPEIIRYITFPTLRIYIKNLICIFFETGNYNIAALAEHLVDGMDLDMAWFDNDSNTFDNPKQREFAAGLILGKRSRLSPLSEGWLSPCVRDHSERARVYRIAGYKP